MCSTEVQWADWLLSGRYEHQTEDERRQALKYLFSIRDRVLDRAALQPDDVVLDVGAGMGLLSFGVLERPNFRGQVIVSDVSRSCIEVCKELARQRGIRSHVGWLQTDGGALAVASHSVNVVMCRSVLVFVRDKARAIAEFHRVLRPAGRVSIFEPILRSRSSNIDFSPIRVLHHRAVRAIAEHRVSPAILSLDFDEGDLVRFFRQAGFVRLNLAVESYVNRLGSEEAIDCFFLRQPVPGCPSLQEVLGLTLSDSEVAVYKEHWYAALERGPIVLSTRLAYLSGQRID